VHGASRDAINYCRDVLLCEINSVTDNPNVFVEEDLILSGGNFHGQPLALSADFLAIAVAELGSISERRIYRLLSGERQLPPFLNRNSGLHSGLMIPQYTAASLVSQNKQLCTPSSVDSIPSCNEQEDHVSMGANGAVKALQVAENTETVIAIEFMTAMQALEFRKPLKTSPMLEELHTSYRKEVSFIEKDRRLYEDINKTVEFIRKIAQDLDL
jgi:histidine ammonia-lyase